MMIWIVIQFSMALALSPEEFKAFYKSKNEKQQHNLGSRFPMPHFVRPMNNKMSIVSHQQNPFHPNQALQTTKQPTFINVDSFPSQQTQHSINKLLYQLNEPNPHQDINKLIQSEKSLVKIRNMYKSLKNLSTSTMKPSTDHRFTIPPDYIRDPIQLFDRFDSRPNDQRPIWRLYGFRKSRKDNSNVKTSIGPDNQSIFSTRIKTGIEVDKKQEMSPDYVNSTDLFEVAASYNRPKRFDENVMKRPKARICKTPKGYIGKCLPHNICHKTKGTSEYSMDCGFHVCCINLINECEMAVMYNNTIWRKPEGGESKSSCSLKIFKLSKSICQIKLDLKEFELSEPTNGSCRHDAIVVSGQNVNSIIPRLCGTASGDHLFIDVDNATGPVELNIVCIGEFQRKWDIIVSQIECTNPERPPANCLQYHTNTSGTFRSFNRKSIKSQYLNNLNYAICIKKPAGFCSIQYEVSKDQEFNLTNIDGGKNSNNKKETTSNNCKLQNYLMITYLVH
ncbi:hypothetical protein Avbf_08243, partial [Armadillidium vulgare]